MRTGSNLADINPFRSHNGRNPMLQIIQQFDKHNFQILHIFKQGIE